MISILSTKKLSENNKQKLLDHSISLFEENFIETKNKEFKLVNINENLIFTSQNAVLSLLQNPNTPATRESCYAEWKGNLPRLRSPAPNLFCSRAP